MHESEVQRQHVRIQIPAGVRIGKNTYKIKDLSAGGLSIITDKNFLFDKEEKEGTILFPFENFSFNLKIKLNPIYSKPDKKITGFRFEDVTPRQTSLLHHVIKSYLSGLITTEEDIIAVAARENYAPAKEEVVNTSDHPAKTFIGRLVPITAIAAVGLLGLSLLVGNIYENTAMIKSYVGVVEGNIFTARAQQNGEFYSLLAKGTEQVTKSQPMAVVKIGALAQGMTPATAAGPGTSITVESPCDCLVVSQYPQDGEFVAMGEPIFKLQPINDYMWVTATLKPEQLHRLRLQDSARIKIAGEADFIEGNVTEFIPPSAEKDLTRVKIRTKQAIPSTMTGRLAYVEFLIH